MEILGAIVVSILLLFFTLVLAMTIKITTQAAADKDTQTVFGGALIGFSLIVGGSLLFAAWLELVFG